jgi:hypothetical protein
MARLFTCGFEEGGSLAAMWNTITGTTPVFVTSATTTPHSGTYCINTNAGAVGSRVRYNPLGTASNKSSGTAYTRFYFRTDTPTPGSDTVIAGTASSGGTSAWTITLLTTGALRLTNSPTAGTADTTTTLSADTWYRIEVRHLIHNSAGELELRLFTGDETSALETESFTGVDTSPGAGTGISEWSFGKATAVAGTHSYDDIAINDDSGAFQTSWCGPGKIYLLKPDGDVTNEWEDETAGASTYANIDDFPGTVDDADYNVEAATLNSTDRFTLTALGAEVTADADLAVAAVYARCGSNQTSAANMQLKLHDEGGTTSTGGSISCNVSGWIPPLTAAQHLVVDISSKTKANLASFEVGYENVTDDQTRPRRVSALWVNVEWLEAAAAPYDPGAQTSLGSFNQVIFRRRWA